jgi:hypothetical protein
MYLGFWLLLFDSETQVVVPNPHPVAIDLENARADVELECAFATVELE